MESLRIKSASALTVNIPLRFTFRHALASRSEGEAIVLCITGQDGQMGFGECAPRSYVSGETLESVREALKTSLVPRVLGAGFSDFGEAISFLSGILVELPRNQHAAFCALELALLDLAGKRFNRSAGDAIGPVALQEVYYSAIVSADGVPEALKTCEMAKGYGFRSVKVKVGLDPQRDLEVLRGARRILGDSCSLRADANCAWDLEEALRRLDAFTPVRLDGLEQPLRQDDLEGLSRLTRQSPIPIIADESLVSYVDAQRLADHAACHCFNIRISKCGGLLNSLRIRELGRKAGIGCMLGAQVGETALLSAAGRHFATRSPEARFLEGSYGSILLEEDIAREDLTIGPGGKGAALPGPGLGIEVDEARLSNWVREPDGAWRWVMSFWSSCLIRWKGGKAARWLEAAANAPGEVQHRKLLEITARNRDTEYGRRHGFAGIKGFGEWRKQVPVVNYEDLRPLVERVTRGERNILTAEDPVMFAQTSGTTGEPKYIPITPTCQKRCSIPLRVWLYHARRDHPAICHGKVVSLVSPAVEGRTPAGLPYGSTSGHMYRNVPWVIRSTYAVPYEIFETGNYENKYYALMRIGLNADVTYFTTANPSSIIKICEVANSHADRLLKDLADGTLTLPQEPDLPREVREIILARCPRDPDRARKLERARSLRGGKLLPADYWPNLALIGCWKGGTVGVYLDRFPAWFDPDGKGGTKVRDLGYLASEARVSIPLSDDGSGGVLAIANNLYEFVEVADLESNSQDPQAWNFLGVSDLVLGKEYYVFLTTTGGLYRYDINDIVRVAGHYRKTPVIEFCRKGRGMTSITGEKVHVNQVIRAFESASRELGIPVDHFKAEADAGRARYVFKVECSEEFPAWMLRSYLLALDCHLAASNLEYHAKRRSGRLNPPELYVMRSGWYAFHRNRELQSRKRDFQRKTIRLSPEELEPHYVKCVIHFEEAGN